MRLVDRIAGLQLVVAMAALVTMGAVTAADVTLKYLFSRPIVGAYDLVESLLPVVVFYGLPSALLRRQNIVIDLVDHLAGLRGARMLVAASDVVVVALLGLITWAMIGPALQTYAYGDRKVELGLLIAVVWAVVILGVAGSVLAAAALLGRPSTRTVKGK